MSSVTVVSDEGFKNETCSVAVISVFPKSNPFPLKTMGFSLSPDLIRLHNYAMVQQSV